MRGLILPMRRGHQSRRQLLRRAVNAAAAGSNAKNVDLYDHAALGIGGYGSHCRRVSLFIIEFGQDDCSVAGVEIDITSGEIAELGTVKGDPR